MSDEIKILIYFRFKTFITTVHIKANARKNLVMARNLIRKAKKNEKINQKFLSAGEKTRNEL